MRCFVPLLLLVTLPVPVVEAQFVPQRANQYKRTLISSARLVMGLDAPTSTLGSQVHQESAWRPDAKSIYAAGLSQFTPATAQDMGRWYPELANVDVYNPQWSLLALVRYDQRLLNRVKATAASECDAWAMTLAQFNGGPGWIDRDKRLAASKGADPDRWWGHVEKYSSRASWAFAENRAYPKRILLILSPIYDAALWGRAIKC